MIIAGDIGGTKTRLALFEVNNGKLKKGPSEQYQSSEFKSLTEIISLFLSKHKTSPQIACFGVPGPVIEAKSNITNLPWLVSQEEISSQLKIPNAKLVNDLVATAAAIPILSDNEILTLHKGKKPQDTYVSGIIAPGTGLGQAYLYMNKGMPLFLPSEGGHSNFAPSNQLEIDLLKYLKQKFNHVSLEHILSGPGLINIYNFLKDSGLETEEDELKIEINNNLHAALITKNAEENKFKICVKTLDIFVDILGAHSSNFLLNIFATGGVYLGGGIVPKILKKLQDGSILKTYLDKGKMRNLVSETSLYVITNDHAAIIGAANIAFSMQ